MGGQRQDAYVLEHAHVYTADDERHEWSDGHVVVQDGVVVAVGDGPADAAYEGRRVDARGCLITPGFVNTHHHLYQWVTRGFAVDGTLFQWLTTLYPVWSHLDEDTTRTAATGALATLALTGATTTTDHHYVFPRGGGDLLAAEVEAARTVGLRFHPTRGSMDLGQSKGGLPPDHVVEDIDAVLDASASAIDRFHDPSPGSMLRVALAPCSPFSVTADLLRASAGLARERDVRLHTHLAETLDEQDYCREHFGSTPVDYMETLGWLGPDVWFAHAVHLDDASIATMAATGTGAAHCPSSNARLGAGIARVRDLRDADVPVGLGVDGAASNEAASMWEEVRHAVLFARARGGPQALTVRDAVDLATRGGARVLGRQAEIGQLAVGFQGDLAVWDLSSLAHVDVADPLAALVLGSQPPLRLLLVRGEAVVEDGALTTVDVEQVAAEVAASSRALLQRAGVVA
ncbi:8-oxoguanine deaminase [Microlunatus flavus]|uniref:Cytosine/adenosine deaminase n=1 Tax=Microlunatus flavus TaxID=1036181 RepID=A0A1H9KVB9_9ACTN|nr:8-oxoguanine deaminase [Microlunatus flavus]SER02979.1 Cytosine/adenosine deaminase [Microlunatus flavus]